MFQEIGVEDREICIFLFFSYADIVPFYGHSHNCCTSVINVIKVFFEGMDTWIRDSLVVMR